jgi:MFS family permease
MDETVPDRARRTTGLALARDPNFRRLWLAGAFGEGTRWLEVLAISIYVYDVTQSALVVTLVTFVRALPMVAFGAVTGALAERAEPRRILLYGTVGMTAVSFIMAAITYAGMAQVWHLGIAGFLSGLLFSTEFPVRRRLLGEFAGPDRIGSAMGFDSVTRTATRILGPLLGGALLQFVGLHGAFVLAGAVYLVVVLLLIGVPRRPISVVASAASSFFSNLAEGLRYVRSNRPLLGFLAVTIIMNLWVFPYQSMVPAIAQDVLQVKPFLVGVLFGVEGLGAMIGALLVAMIEPRHHYLRLYVFGAALAMLAVGAFSLSDSYGLSLVICLVGGFGLAGFTTMQATLPFIMATPEVRARVLGLVSVCIGLGPIGQLHLGFLSEWLGPPLATTISAVEGLVALTIAAGILVGRRLWERRPLDQA